MSYNNDGYKCNVTCDYKPRDVDSVGQSIPSAVVTSARTVKPFDNLVSNEVLFQVTSVLFPEISNNSVSIGFTLPVSLATNLAAIGLDFRHYKVDLVSQTDQSVHKTTNITNIATSTHTFAGVSYNNDGYKCKVTCDYKPRDADSVGQSIPSAVVTSSRTVIPFDNVVNDDSNFTMLTPSLDSFTNTGANNSLVVSWQHPASLATYMAAKGLSFKHYYLELVDNADDSSIQTPTQVNMNTLTHTFTDVSFNNDGYKFKVSTYYEPLDTVSLAASVEVIGAVAQDARILIPYDTNIAGETTFDVDSVDFGTFDNTLVNSFVVNWVKPTALATTISDVGLAFGKYLVQLYVADDATNIVASSDVTNITTATTTFSSVAYNNTGYKVKITSYYNPLDSENSATNIVSDVVHNTRTLIPYEQVVNDDTNYQVTSVSIDEFTNAGIDHSANVSWAINTTSLQTNLTNIGLNFSKYLVELVDKDDDTVAKTVDITTITTLTKTFTDIPYNTAGYTCRVKGYFVPKDTVSSATVEVLGASVVSSRTLIPYDKVVSDDDANFAVQTVAFVSFENVALKNSVHVSWTVPVGLAANIANVGMTFKHYLVELIDQDDSSIVSDTITNISTLTKTFTAVAYSTNGYKFRTTAVFMPRDVDDSGISVSSTPLTTTRTLIPYDKVIDSQNFVVTYETNNSKELTVNWDSANNLNGVGLQIKHYIVKLYSSSNVELASDTLLVLTKTFIDLSLNQNAHYSEVSAVYKPRDLFTTASVEVTGGFYSEISNTVNIYDVTAAVTEFVSMELVQLTSTKSAVNLTANWVLPDYAANNLLLSTIELDLVKNGVTVVQTDTFTENYISNQFTNIPYTSGDYFTINMRLTLKSTSNDLYTGDYQATAIKVYPQLDITDITGFDMALTLTETVGNINSDVNMSWSTQTQFMGNYEFVQYNIVVHNNTDNVEVYNVNQANLATVSYDALNVVNGKTYNYKVTAQYTSYVDPSGVIVMTPTNVESTDNLNNNTIGSVNFISMDISLNTDTIAFDFNPNGKLINKVQYLAIPDDITTEDNHTDSSNNFQIVVDETVSLIGYGTVNHSYDFTTATHGWNASKGIRLAVVNLFTDDTVLHSEIKIL